jgi:hypothetical protein
MYSMTEQQLDQHITDCGHRMTAAYAAGDRDDAQEWCQRMYAAIKSRSPEHRARLIARIDSAVWFQSPEALELGRVG